MEYGLAHVYYKDPFVGLVKEFGECYANGYRAVLYDTNGNFITYFEYEPSIEKVVRDLVKSNGQEDIIQLLLDYGIASYSFFHHSIDDDYPIRCEELENYAINNPHVLNFSGFCLRKNVREDLLDDFTDEEVFEFEDSDLEDYIYNNDYVNQIGDKYIRLA